MVVDGIHKEVQIFIIIHGRGGCRYDSVMSIIKHNLQNHPKVGRVGVPICKLSLLVSKHTTFQFVCPMVCTPQFVLCEDNMTKDRHIKGWMRNYIVFTKQLYIALCQGTTPMMGI